MRPQYLNVAGRRMVVLEEADFEQLAKKADVWEPALPEPNERANYPIEALHVLIAKDILRARRKLGLTQVEISASSNNPQCLVQDQNLLLATALLQFTAQCAEKSPCSPPTRSKYTVITRCTLASSDSRRRPMPRW
ncbi:MAG: hypothetical protein L0Y72_12625 [Gemmataceae bacterium]|nr:hypothetical protein [Gemmataceae bacterium]MCI0739883.1 hypothetical protein [Gemmataceae bacterium]